MSFISEVPRAIRSAQSAGSQEASFKDVRQEFNNLVSTTQHLWQSIDSLNFMQPFLQGAKNPDEQRVLQQGMQDIQGIIEANQRTIQEGAKKLHTLINAGSQALKIYQETQFKKLETLRKNPMIMNPSDIVDMLDPNNPWLEIIG